MDPALGRQAEPVSTSNSSAAWSRANSNAASLDQAQHLGD
jgi:hypothetical protein